MPFRMREFWGRERGWQRGRRKIQKWRKSRKRKNDRNRFPALFSIEIVVKIDLYDFFKLLTLKVYLHVRFQAAISHWVSLYHILIFCLFSKPAGFAKSDLRVNEPLAAFTRTHKTQPTSFFSKTVIKYLLGKWFVSFNASLDGYMWMQPWALLILLGKSHLRSI